MATDRNDRSEGNVLRTLLRELKANPFFWISSALICSVGSGIIFFRSKGLYPSDILYQLTFALGGACLIALISAILDRHYVTHEFGRIVRRELRDSDDAQRSLARQGIVRAHEPPFDFKLLFAEARKGDEIWWLDTYCPRKDEFLRTMTEALAGGIRIRMLTIKRESANSLNRSRELAGTPDTGQAWETGLTDFHRRMETLVAGNPKGFELREYDDLPGLPMYLVVGAAGARCGFFSFFLSQPSAHFAHFELQAGPLLQAMQEYFAEKWKRWSPRASVINPSVSTTIAAPSELPPVEKSPRDSEPAQLDVAVGGASPRS